MSAILIANVKVTDDAWLPEYATHVHDIVHKHGGKYLARSANITNIEGTAPDTTVIAVLVFPSMDELQAFVNDPDYAKYAQSRQAGSVSHLHAIDDTDVAGTIPYLPNGS